MLGLKILSRFFILLGVQKDQFIFVTNFLFRSITDRLTFRENEARIFFLNFREELFDWHKNRITLSYNFSIDVPPRMSSIVDFRASLGHKVSENNLLCIFAI